MPKKMVVFEINEFNWEYLQEAAEKLDLKNILAMQAMEISETSTDDTTESGYLEPWSQWVSVHTGTPAQDHRIRHLGDVGGLNNKQMWEVLSEKRITSGIWGPMNATRGEAALCRFFVPDPWSFTEDAYPEELTDVLALPRYAGQNYFNISKLKSGLLVLRFCKPFLLSKRLRWVALKELANLLIQFPKHRGQHFTASLFLDYLAFRGFMEYRKRTEPDFTLFFFNSIAHLQHQHWNKEKPINENNAWKYGMRYLDRILGELSREIDDQEAFVILNGLSQKSTHDEPAWLLYKIIDHQRFFEKSGLNVERVEPHMTYDAHGFFPSLKHKEAARKALVEATVLGRRLFYLEDYENDPMKLFYRIDFAEEIDEEAVIHINGRSLVFGEHLKKVVRRTGRHVQHGIVLSRGLNLPDKMHNHEIFNHILEYFETGREMSTGNDGEPQVNRN